MSHENSRQDHDRKDRPDPVVTDPDKYRVVFENERVRVLEYLDSAGARTSPHAHPDSVMVTLTSFRRRLHHQDGTRDVELPAGLATWLPAQQHSGENIGDGPTHTVFVELKEPAPSRATPSGSAGGAVGPDLG
jgi:quercetin dioxygenase-like cupin family protein